MLSCTVPFYCNLRVINYVMDSMFSDASIWREKNCLLLDKCSPGNTLINFFSVLTLIRAQAAKTPVLLGHTARGHN